MPTLISGTQCVHTVCTCIISPSQHVHIVQCECTLSMQPRPLEWAWNISPPTTCLDATLANGRLLILSGWSDWSPNDAICLVAKVLLCDCERAIIFWPFIAACESNLICTIDDIRRFIWILLSLFGELLVPQGSLYFTPPGDHLPKLDGLCKSYSRSKYLKY